MGKAGLFKILFKLFKSKKSKDKKNKAKKQQQQQQQSQGFAVQPLQHNIQNGQVSYRPATAQQPQGGYYPPPPPVQQQQQQPAYYQQAPAAAPSQAQRPPNAAVNGIIANHVAGIAYEMGGHKGSKKAYEKAANSGLDQYNKWQQKQQQGPVPVGAYGAPAA